jgi:uncharacterized protein
MDDLVRNKSVARQAAETLGALNIEEFLGLLADDVSFETPVRHEVFAGQKTKEQLRKELGMMKDILPNGVVLTIQTITAEDDRVHLELVGKAKTANGRDYNNRYHWFLQVRDGKIRAFRDYFDSDYAIRQLF